MDKKKLSIREWILIIILISVIQAVIWYISFVNSGNPSSLNYVSFAGTLISIILAVLAIGYTYGESISEKNKSNAISNQIETLNGILKNLSIQSSSLEQISVINNELQQLSTRFKKETGTTHQKVEDLKASLETFLQNSTEAKSDNVDTINNNYLVKVVENTDSYAIRIAVLMLYYVKKKQLPNDRIITNLKPLFEEANKISDEKEIRIISSNLYLGGIAIIQQMLQETGVIHVTNNELNISSELIDVIENWYNDSPKKINDYGDVLFKLIVDKLNE